MNEVSPDTIHYTALPPASPDSPLATEYNFYRREVGRLLAEGHEGKWVLIKNEEILGIWDTLKEVREVALWSNFGQPCLLQQILPRERILQNPLSYFSCHK